MLSELYQALTEHLSLLGIPVFQADCVPQGTALPYLTLNAVSPLGPDSTGTLTLTIWAQSSAARIILADSVAALLPPYGKAIILDTGTALLLPSGMATPAKESVIPGMRMVWKLRIFPGT